MASELITSLSLFKTMLDMAKGLKDINDAAVRNRTSIELQEKILAAQGQQSALIDRIRELEEKVAGFKDWEAKKQRYELHDFGGGTFAYTLKEGVKGGEPAHHVCANCFQKQQISVLQFRYTTATKQSKYFCPACQTDFLLGERHDPPVIRRRGSASSWMRR